MRAFFIYWMIGCFITGCGSALHAKRCPNEPEMSSSDALIAIAIWPAGAFYVMTDHEIPECKQLNTIKRPEGTK